MVLDGVTESNGLGWSLDGGTFYYIDSGEPWPRIRAFPCDLAAAPGAPRDLVQPPPEHGTPDGPDGGRRGMPVGGVLGRQAVRRYSAAGGLPAELPIPVSQPSCPAFGGPDLADLYDHHGVGGHDTGPAGRGTPGRAPAARPGRGRGGSRAYGASPRDSSADRETSVSRIALEGITKRYQDGTTAVRSLDLSIADGELMVLVGPSGCGKTTALRMVAGLEEITEGTILIDGQPVNDMEPRDRDIAMVFQSYALYPHLTVRDNMAFSLKYRKTPKQEIRRRVDEAARILELDELLGRKPRQLSGGQRQRVAMGRAIVRQPRAFLMDEPLSNLDAKLRVQMRAEIAKLQRSLGVTTIYVTHDQTEAMTLGSRVAVLRHGVLQQVAAPQELYPSGRPTCSWPGSSAHLR